MMREIVFKLKENTKVRTAFVTLQKGDRHEMGKGSRNDGTQPTFGSYGLGCLIIEQSANFQTNWQEMDANDPAFMGTMRRYIDHDAWEMITTDASIISSLDW